MNQRPNLQKNPLRRDGVSQRQRLTPALSPDKLNAAQVDERDLADFLVLAYRLSEQVYYYNIPGTQLSNSSSNRAVNNLSAFSLSSLQDGDWRDFFEDYAPVQIALISKIRPQAVKCSYDKLFNSFLKQPSCNTLVPILTLWRTSILMPVHLWYQTLGTYTPFRATIKDLVNTNLGEPINQIIALEQVCEPEKIITRPARLTLLVLWWKWYVTLQRDRSTNPALKPTLLDRCWLTSLVYVLIPNFYEVFKELFQLPLVPELGALSSDVFFTLEADSHREIDGIFQVLFQVYRQIIHQAPTYLDASLGDRRDHPPHLALYVAMLDVLQPARDDLNRITQRHLDFFYRQVLALPGRPATPDYAHLLFELAKPQREYKLAAGTRFKAGKDATGVELFYALDQDMVVHKASIASLRGLFLESSQFPSKVPADLKRLLASPVANSFDGQGEAFPKEQAIKAWLPFGGPRIQTSSTQGTSEQPDIQGIPAQLGVAIASDVLLLQEGVRTITLVLSLDSIFQPLDGLDLKQAFVIYLSGEKDWILAQAVSDDESPAMIESATWDGSNSTLVITVRLTAEVDPILPYDPSNPIPFQPDTPNLSLTLERPLPVLRLELTPSSLDPEGRSAYHYFRDVSSFRI